MQYFLILLFLGYYGSVTLFTHTHHTENGVTITHSHPFSSPSKNSNHQHTKNEYILIQLLSNFLTIATFLTFSIEVCKTVFKKIKLQKNDRNFCNLTFLISNKLRAPPLNIHS